MNNKQAFAKLMKIQRTNKDFSQDCEDVMHELAAAADLAARNLKSAAMGGMLDKLILKSPSHGGDI